VDEIPSAPPPAHAAVNAISDLRSSTANLGLTDLTLMRGELASILNRVRLMEIASPASLDAKDARWSHADSA